MSNWEDLALVLRIIFNLAQLAVCFRTHCHVCFSENPEEGHGECGVTVSSEKRLGVSVSSGPSTSPGHVREESLRFICHK